MIELPWSLRSTPLGEEILRTAALRVPDGAAPAPRVEGGGGAKMLLRDGTTGGFEVVDVRFPAPAAAIVVDAGVDVATAAADAFGAAGVPAPDAAAAAPPPPAGPSENGKRTEIRRQDAAQDQKTG